MATPKKKASTAGAKAPVAKAAPPAKAGGAAKAGAKDASRGGRLLTAKGVPVTDKPWPKKELAHFEKRLMEERKRVMKQLAQWDESMRSTIQNADGDLSAYSFHMADQGTDAMEREKAFLFASKEGRYLWHIDQALRRLYKMPELFGICEMTGQRIEYERLDALPHARLSYKAKREEEGDGDLE
jgi:DnaK suppressor protein